MPLVRIDLPASTSDADTQAVSEGVHDALVETFNVPRDDRFQVVSRQPEGAIICTPEYLGVRHSRRVVFVQIACAPGRTLDQKRSLYSAIAGNVASRSTFLPADVIINLVETHRENWSFGNGIAHYAI